MRRQQSKHKLPANDELELKRRTFGGVDRTWSNREYNLMVCKAMETNHNDYAAILTLARYGGLRLEECFRIDTNDAEKAIAYHRKEFFIYIKPYKPDYNRNYKTFKL